MLIAAIEFYFLSKYAVIFFCFSFWHCVNYLSHASSEQQNMRNRSIIFFAQCTKVLYLVFLQRHNHWQFFIQRVVFSLNYRILVIYYFHHFFIHKNRWLLFESKHALLSLAINYSRSFLELFSIEINIILNSVI